MAEQEDFVEEDLFADLYEADEPTDHAPPAAAAATSDKPNAESSGQQPSNEATAPSGAASQPAQLQEQSSAGNVNASETSFPAAETSQTSPIQSISTQQDAAHAPYLSESEQQQQQQQQQPQQQQGTGIKEDGKMFIGGLNWETTDQSLKDYFSQFGEVQECTVMRDGATGRSRGFGFLTFKDPKTVNTVMVKEHYLDGKIIDPKRAIPRDEQERTSKIFVGGVSQDATEQDFKQFFMQFGRVVDATLMIDKDTGRPRGFGFVTFDSEAAVEATLSQPLEILGKPIEVKKAQPRGNLRDEERNRRMNDRFRDYERPMGDVTGMQGGQAAMSGMTPAMMAQYWQRMQQYFMLMQQQMAMAASQGQGMGMGMGMGMPAMNPMMQQMQAQMGGVPQGAMPQGMPQGMPHGMPHGMPQGGAPAGPQGMSGMMNQGMMQQHMAQAPNGAYGAQSSAMEVPMGGAQMAANPSNAGSSSAAVETNNHHSPKANPAYNAQEQLAFEQQKLEQQQSRRSTETRSVPPYHQQGGPTSWEGMYDETPQPSVSTQPHSRGTPVQAVPTKTPTPGPKPASTGPPQQPVSAPPANAPTGPRNAGRPGANYRGGGRGGHRGFHPYSRPN